MPTNSPLNVVAILLNWNSSEDSITLYKQLNSLEFGKNIDLTIWIVDNDSNQTEQLKLKKIPENNLIFTGKNLGYAGGNNVAIKKAIEESFDYICILNPDIRIKEDFITPLIKILEENKSIGVIGPRICYRKKNNQIYSDGGLVIPEKGYETKHLNHDKFKNKVTAKKLNDVSYVNGSAMISPTSSFNTNGLFREDFFLYFEETEWCLRLLDNNKRVVTNPTIEVFHQSSNKGANFYFYMQRNRIWLAKIRKEYIFTTIVKSLSLLPRVILSAIKNPQTNNITQYPKIKGVFDGIFKSP